MLDTLGEKPHNRGLGGWVVTKKKQTLSLTNILYKISPLEAA